MTAATDTRLADAVDTAGDEWLVRKRATAILDENPHLSPSGFAGKLFDRTRTNPDTALALYADLVDGETVEFTQDRADPDDDLEDTDTGDERGDSGTEALADTIDGYYAQLDERGVYGDLGEITADDAGTDTGLSCIGNNDYYGWYRTRDGEGRGHALSKEFGVIRDKLDRVFYATVNYAPPTWFMDAWKPFEWVEDEDKDEGEDGKWTRGFDGGKPLPGYGDVLAYAPFADIDLADDVKTDRPAGDVPVDDLEDALARYIDAFADLAGGRDHVFALDSVGGAYVMIAPTATAPIATEFDREDRAVLFDELTDRLNEWLEDVGDRVTEATDLAGVFEPDAVNHKNRLYKAPLSVHKSLDGVVTPIDTDAPTYEFTPFEDADSALVDETRAWVDGFTGDHRGAVDAIVATLWPEYYEDADTWDAALAAWLEDQQEADQEHSERERKRIPADEIPDDLETTDDLNVIKSKIEGIDVREVARSLADEWDTDPGREPKRFDPPWRYSERGDSCFATRDKFVDDANSGKGGGALEFVALERGILNSPGDKLRGRDYWRAVNALRDEGYNIPYYEGPDGRHADVLRLFTEPDGQEEKKKQLARALFADRS